MFFPHWEANVTGQFMPIFITHFVDRIPESVNFSHLGAWHGMANDGRNGLGQERHVWRLRDGECKKHCHDFHR